MNDWLAYVSWFPAARDSLSMYNVSSLFSLILFSCFHQATIIMINKQVAAFLSIDSIAVGWMA